MVEKILLRELCQMAARISSTTNRLTSPGMTLAIVVILTRPTSAETGMTQMIIKPLHFLVSTR